MSPKAFLPILIGISFMMSGCGYFSVLMRHAFSGGYTLMEVRKNAPESCAVLYGRVERNSPDSIFPSMVAAFPQDHDSESIISRSDLNGSGYYSLYLPPGRYTLAAFCDRNHDGWFSSDECVWGDSCGAYVCVKDRHIEHGPMISKTKPAIFSRKISVKAVVGKTPESSYFPAGAIRSLDDPIFDPDLGKMGLFDPSSFT